MARHEYFGGGKPHKNRSGGSSQTKAKHEYFGGGKPHKNRSGGGSEKPPKRRDRQFG